jgi:L-fuculose-phosphate aldolase
MDTIIEQTRARIAEFGALLFARRLTDAAGGNISVRVGDRVCITSRYSGSRYQWNVRPEQVLVTDLAGVKLAGDGEISREAKVHYRLLTVCPAGMAVIHAHSRNTLVFCAAAQPIPPVLECTLKFGTIEVVPYAPAHSDKLADNIANVIKSQEDRVRKQAAAVIAPWHGLFVLGKDLDAAFDAVERIDTNAHCILAGRALAGFDGGSYAPTSDLREALSAFQD